MGKSIVDRWSQNLVGKRFEWGKRDCHTVTIEYIKLQNLDTEVENPYLYTALNRKYSNSREGHEQAKTFDFDAGLEELGYKLRPVNRVEAGDIIKIEINNKSYNHYMPVIFGETLLWADVKSRKIKLGHITQVGSDYKVYRR